MNLLSINNNIIVIIYINDLNNYYCYCNNHNNYISSLIE